MKVSLKQKISEQAKTMAQLNRSCEVLEKLRTCRNCLGACEFEDEDSFKGRFVREDVVCGLLDKAIVEIEKKAFRKGVGYWENAVMLADVRKILLGVVEAEQK